MSSATLTGRRSTVDHNAMTAARRDETPTVTTGVPGSMFQLHAPPPVKRHRGEPGHTRYVVTFTTHQEVTDGMIINTFTTHHPRSTLISVICNAPRLPPRPLRTHKPFHTSSLPLFYRSASACSVCLVCVPAPPGVFLPVERWARLYLVFLGVWVGWVCRGAEDPLPTYSRWSLPASG